MRAEERDAPVTAAYTPMDMDLKSANIELRRGFVQKVYGILSAQLLLTIVVAYPCATMSDQLLEKYSWLPALSLFTMLAFVLVISCCRDTMRTFPKNYICLGIWTAATGTMTGLACRQYSAPIILIAMMITAVDFLLLTAYAFTTKTDFTGYAPYLWTGLCVLTLVSCVFLFLSMFGKVWPLAQMGYCTLVLLIFQFYVIFDTQLMLGQWGGHELEFSIDDYAFAAMSLYLDIINLFLNIVQILGLRDN